MFRSSNIHIVAARQLLQVREVEVEWVITLNSFKIWFSSTLRERFVFHNSLFSSSFIIHRYPPSSNIVVWFQCHDHATYLVDALIDTNPMIKDWQTMVDLLLSDEGYFSFSHPFSLSTLLKFRLQWNQVNHNSLKFWCALFVRPPLANHRLADP